MDEIDHPRGRPERIGEVLGIGNDQLLHVDDVGDESEVDDEERDQRQVQRPFAERLHDFTSLLSENISPSSSAGDGSKFSAASLTNMESATCADRNYKLDYGVR